MSDPKSETLSELLKGLKDVKAEIQDDQDAVQREIDIMDGKAHAWDDLSEGSVHKISPPISALSGSNPVSQTFIRRPTSTASQTTSKPSVISLAEDHETDGTSFFEYEHGGVTLAMRASHFLVFIFISRFDIHMKFTTVALKKDISVITSF